MHIWDPNLVLSLLLTPLYPLHSQSWATGLSYLINKITASINVLDWRQQKCALTGFKLKEEWRLMGDYWKGSQNGGGAEPATSFQGNRSRGRRTWHHGGLCTSPLVTHLTPSHLCVSVEIELLQKETLRLGRFGSVCPPCGLKGRDRSDIEVWV